MEARVEKRSDTSGRIGSFTRSGDDLTKWNYLRQTTLAKKFISKDVDRDFGDESDGEAGYEAS